VGRPPPGSPLAGSPLRLIHPPPKMTQGVMTPLTPLHHLFNSILERGRKVLAWQRGYWARRALGVPVQSTTTDKEMAVSRVLFARCRDLLLDPHKHRRE
jgi:hypothetical protein